MDSRMFQFVIVVAIIFILMGIFVFYLGANEKHYENQFFDNLEAKMNYEVQQIYWYWQQQGRPSLLGYKPKNKTTEMRLKMGLDGDIDIEKNADSCMRFLSGFIEQSRLEQAGLQSATVTTIDRQMHCRYIFENAEFVFNSQQKMFYRTR